MKIILFLILHFKNTGYLIKLLQEQFEMNGFKFYCQFSGRVAIYKLALVIKEKNKKTIALIPDYICNVVNIALETAGYKIQTYQTNDMLEPDFLKLKQALLNNDIGILLTASICGSSALLDKLKEDDFKEYILQKNIYVIVDICQDINLIKDLPNSYENNLVAVISFNDKSFLGIMGGGILSRFFIESSLSNVSLYNLLQLYKMLILKFIHGSKYGEKILKLMVKTKGILRSLIINTLKKKTEQENNEKYDYSMCTNFPYQIKDYKVQKIQIIMAIIGRQKIHEININKQKIFSQNIQFKKTRYFDTSPYLILDNIGELGELNKLNRKIKRPYAVHNKPHYSIKDDLVIIHNKGFLDRA